MTSIPELPVGQPDSRTQETDKQIIRKLMKVKPTKEEVDVMDEYTWISCVAPLKYYKLGYETALEQCQTIAEELIKDEIKFLEDTESNINDLINSNTNTTSELENIDTPLWSRVDYLKQQLNPAQTKDD